MSHCPLHHCRPAVATPTPRQTRRGWHRPLPPPPTRRKARIAASHRGPAPTARPWPQRSVASPRTYRRPSSARTRCSACTRYSRRRRCSVRHGRRVQGEQDEDRGGGTHGPYQNAATPARSNRYNAGVLRLVLNALAVLSLILCLAAVALAVRSRGTEDFVSHSVLTPRPAGEIACTEWTAMSVGGAVIAARRTYLWPAGSGLIPDSNSTWESDRAQARRTWGFFGYEAQPPKQGAADRFQEFVVVPILAPRRTLRRPPSRNALPPAPSEARARLLPPLRL